MRKITVKLLLFLLALSPRFLLKRRQFGKSINQALWKQLNQRKVGITWLSVDLVRTCARQKSVLQ